MPKTNAATVETTTNDLPDYLDKYEGVAVGDIPDKDPVLAEGDWEFEFINFTVKSANGDNGQYTIITAQLDPVSPVDVEEPNEDYENLRQFHTMFIMRPGDAGKSVGRFVKAFGVNDQTPLYHREENGEVVWDALEEVRGNRAEASVKLGKGSKGRDPQNRFYF